MALTKKQRLQRWVKALRSGKYKQGTGSLRQNVYDDNGNETGKFTYCCLGVLCDLEAPQDWEGNVMYGIGSVAPEKIAKRVGIGETEDRDIQDDLANMNDDQGLSFKHIAAWIEKNLINKPVKKGKK